MKILVTGGSGFLGSHVAEQLSQSGHTVRALVRKSSKVEHLRSLAGVELAYGAVEDAAGRLVAFSLDVDRRRGRQGESGVGQPSETYRPETWPDDLRAQLAPHKLPWRR